jgi:hypothetical protein
MVTAGGIDHRHLRNDLQGADGLLEQRSFPAGEQGRPLGSAGGPADGHSGQQAAAVGHRCAGEASVSGGTSPMDPFEADKAGADPAQGRGRLPAFQDHLPGDGYPPGPWMS